jgi:hypothetical protein
MFHSHVSFEYSINRTQLILAVYYTIADIVLLGQCFYYRGFTWRDEVVPPSKPSSALQPDQPTENTGLLHPNGNGDIHQRERRPSNWSTIDPTHLSPVTPLLPAPKPNDPPVLMKPTSRLRATLLNVFAVLLVCLAGLLGWWLSSQSQGGENKHRSDKKTHGADDEALKLNMWGQVFGYFCAVLYLGSRIPQILLNYRRKSTEGISMLFFLFACIGNLTYVLSIFAFEPKCHGRHGKCAPGEPGQIYGRYILVNASWLAGSLGTLFLDFWIFVQFFLYSAKNLDALDEEDATEHAVETPDERPLLDRGNSGYL